MLEMNLSDINDDLPNEVCQNIFQMKKSISALQEENERLSNIINSFTEKTNSNNFSEADQKIEKLCQSLRPFNWFYAG